jgi:hypothetical protein
VTDPDDNGPPRWRRHFVAIATAAYEDPVFAALPGVHAEVAALHKWLCAEDLGERGFTPAHPELAANPDKQQIRAALETPQRPWTRADAAVVFITGHGLDAAGDHRIVLHDSDSRRVTTTMQRTSDLVGWLEETGIEHLMIILDLCHAGATAKATAAFDVDFPRSWLPLASVTSSQKAKTGALTGAIGAFLEDVLSPEGERFSHGPYLRVAEFIEEVQGHLGEHQTLAGLQPGWPSLGPSFCLPNPRWRDQHQPVPRARRDLAIRPAELESHWAPKAKATDEDSAGWLFTGRVELMHQLIAAATGPAATTLVTGMAGTGKSAGLARLVTLSDAEFCHRHQDLVAEIRPDLRPAIGSVGAAILGTGKLPHEVLAQIHEAFTGTSPATGASLTAMREEWWQWLRGHGATVTVVVDALDEAEHPTTLLSEVLSQLNPPATATARVRLIIGVRSPGGPDDHTAPDGRPASDDHLAGGERQALADRAEQLLRARRLRVDEPPLWSDGDLSGYAYELLVRTRSSPYTDPAHHAQARALAVAITTSAGKSFLITRIAASSLAHRSERIVPEDPAWLATLHEGVLGVFRDDLRTSLEPADQKRAVDLLRAVAFAYGAGLPWRQIWPIVANAVVDRPGTYGDSDIAWLLGTRIGAYLVTDQEDGITVYRLFHDTLRTTLRERSNEILQL